VVQIGFHSKSDEKALHEITVNSQG